MGLTPARPEAWPPMGAVLALPTATPRRRLQVFGLLQRHHARSPSVREGTRETSVSGEGVAPCSQPINTSTFVWLANAPLPRSHAGMRPLAPGGKRGCRMQYGPPSSPALNLLERRWRCITYPWCPCAASLALACLVPAVADLRTHCGTEYTIHVQATRVEKNLCSGT